MISFLVFLFRDGWQEQVGVSRSSAREAAESMAAEYCSDGEVTAITQTKVIIGSGPRPYHNPRGGFKHEFSLVERDKPNTLFVDVVEMKEFNRQCKTGDAEFQKRQAAITERIQGSLALDKKRVRFEELPAGWKSRIHASREECWIWLTAKDAPYRNVYSHLKGAVPTGALLRHICDNRRCVNPNHLLLGTHADNTRDMMERGRHPAQKLAMMRLKRRVARQSAVRARSPNARID